MSHGASDIWSGNPTSRDVVIHGKPAAAEAPGGPRGARCTARGLGAAFRHLAQVQKASACARRRDASREGTFWLTSRIPQISLEVSYYMA